MRDMCVSIPKELSTYIILVLTNDYKSYLKCKKQKYKSWYCLLLQSWSLSLSVCLSSGINMFLASKRVSLVMEPKCCNAPIRRVRKHHCDVYTLSISTVKNQSAEAQWSYTFQQNSTSTWLSQKAIQYYRNITSPEIQKYIIWRDIQKLRGAHEQQEGSREPNRRGTGRESCDDDPSFCCALIITEGSAAHSDQLQ